MSWDIGKAHGHASLLAVCYWLFSCLQVTLVKNILNIKNIFCLWFKYFLELSLNVFSGVRTFPAQEENLKMFLLNIFKVFLLILW